MKHVVAVLFAVVATSGMLLGAELTCSFPVDQEGGSTAAIPITFAALRADPAAYCVDQDKMYSNFNVPVGVSGTVSISTLVAFEGTEFEYDQHLISINGNFTTQFTFGYVITVIDPNPARVINFAGVDLTVPAAPPTAPQNTSYVTKELVVLDPASVPLPKIYNLTADVSSSDGIGLYARSIAVSLSLFPSSVISNVTDTYNQTVIPEPGTYALFGAGLLGLGLLRRRLK